MPQPTSMSRCAAEPRADAREVAVDVRLIHASLRRVGEVARYRPCRVAVADRVLVRHLEIALRDDTREEALDLRRRERRAEQVLALVEARGTGGRCSASAGRGPTSRAAPAVVGRPVSNRATSAASSAFASSCRTSGYGSSRCAPSARIRPGSESTISECVIASRASALERALDRRRGAPHRAVQPRAAAPAAQPPAEVLGGDVRRVERLADLRLQARLLVQADLEVRQQRQLGAALRVGLARTRVVARERGRAAAAPRPRTRRRQVARELVADLLEHLQVAARDGVAGQLDRVERRVQPRRDPPEPRVAVEQPAPQQPAPERLQRVQQLAAARRAGPARSRSRPRRGSSGRPGARPRSRTCTSSRPARCAARSPRRAASRRR